MNPWVRFTGILGTVFLAFGLIGGAIVGSFTEPLMLAHLLVGVVLLVTWFLAAGAKGAELQRDAARGRRIRFGANVVLYSAVFVGFLVLANLAAHHYNKRFDLTEQGVYSLTPQSVEVVKALKKPLSIVVINDPNTVNEQQARDLLTLYRSYGEEVHTELIDPRAKPHLVDRYEMKEGNLVYLQYGEDSQKAVSRINEVSEEAITNAIIKLTRGEAKKIYYVEGHGEPSLTDSSEGGAKQLADAIVDEHLTVESLLVGQQGIPLDAAAVILASPKRPLSPQERDALIEYAQGGGRLLLLHDPRTTEDVREIADHFGIVIGEDVIIDRFQTFFGMVGLGAEPIVKTYTPHGVTRGLSATDPTVFYLASSVLPQQQRPEGATLVELVKTGPAAWAERNLAALLDGAEAIAELDEADLRGPVSLAVAYEKQISTDGAPESDEADGEFKNLARVVVFGDADWITNGRLSTYANRNLVLGAINWLVAQEGGVTIPGRSLRRSAAPISQETFINLFKTSFVLPELLLILGLIIWWRRRTAVA